MNPEAIVNDEELVASKVVTEGFQTSDYITDGENVVWYAMKQVGYSWRVYGQIVNVKYENSTAEFNPASYVEFDTVADMQKYNKKVFAVVSNMSIALERRDFLQSIDCFVCNIQEAGILFSDDYTGFTTEQMEKTLLAKVKAARIPSMIVTMGGEGAVYADMFGDKGYCPARKVDVKDTTGAGDSFCAGVAIGLTYGKTLAESCEIGSLLAASVIVTTENVCPRFLPRELGIDKDVVD